MEDTVEVKAKRGRPAYTPEHKAEVEAQRLIAREEHRLIEVEAGLRRATRGRPKLTEPKVDPVEMHARAIAALLGLSYLITKNGIPQFRKNATG